MCVGRKMNNGTENEKGAMNRPRKREKIIGFRIVVKRQFRVTSEKMETSHPEEHR